ncbi:DNA polymerase III subunit beta [Lentibacillus salicampi]|uniref:Beta sliding clamp n=1 Tax=Lentibacillus salicampi TaxID=175306 RepID=A0A4Y9A8X0_9BACI|nr:DNA polymerase III subunit beta [Lentibacillus salicampi]TFJ92296.1 DNA polymerase III subunit beta [Lentibacillus salicampi]
MKFIVQRQQLISSVQDVMKAISSRTAIPILTGMKIEANANGIILTGSDSDITIESFIPAEEDGMINVEQIEEGSVVLQARYFPDIVRKLPDNTVEIESDENFNITIKSGKAQFNLNGQDANEYPHLPNLQAENSFDIQSDLLKDLIKQTGFAVSAMETRPILTGVNITIENETLHFTATDSHRLASRRVPLEGVTSDSSNIVVPGKSLNELNKILDDTGEKVEISVMNNQILFRTKYLHFLSRLLDGNYPETSRLIPDQSQTVLHVRTKELINTIDRASLLAKEERNNVVKLTTKDNQLLQITSNSPEVGQVAEEISVQSLEGENLKISFSSKYMLDALKVIENDEVIIKFTGAMRPFVIQPADDDAILQLILPVRTY